MNNYLKTSLALSIYLASLNAHADYQVNYFLDKKDINFTNTPVVGEWLSTTPSYSDWTYVGDYFDCQPHQPLKHRMKAFNLHKLYQIVPEIEHDLFNNESKTIKRMPTEMLVLLLVKMKTKKT